MSEYFLLDGRRFVPEVSGGLFHVKTDAEVGRIDRPNDPMVWEFAEVPAVLTKEWQFFLRAINPGMTLQYVAALLQDRRAFCNHTGLNGDIARRDYIRGRDLTAEEFPKFDEVRTCGGSTVKWINGYIEMLDGNNPPPLKPGAVQPSTIAQATIDKYLYTPQSHPWLFFGATISREDGTAAPFPNGAVYAWYGTTPISFLPHVCPGGRVRYPPQQRTDNTPELERL